MGLAVVKSIIDAAKGAIAIESTVGKGSTFHIALPLIHKDQEEQLPDWTPPPPCEKTVLFVDDESSILRMATPLLTSIGYKPVVCANQAEVLDTLRSQDFKIDALISDLIMPDCNGIELAQEVHRLSPGLPIIILTGYPEKMDRAVAHTIGVRACLTKPISRQELSTTLELVLQGEDLLQQTLEEKPTEYPPQQNDNPEQN